MSVKKYFFSPIFKEVNECDDKMLQGTIGKSFLGLSRYSYHSKLLTALVISPIEERYV